LTLIGRKDAFGVDLEDQRMSGIPGLRPVHPGELLREVVLPALGRSKTDIARLLGISRYALKGILVERRPITAGLALRIGKLCGNGPDVWVGMQRAYDLKTAQVELAEVVKGIPTLKAVARESL
jgi:addiction module HigA family antidote